MLAEEIRLDALKLAISLRYLNDEGKEEALSVSETIRAAARFEAYLIGAAISCRDD